MADQQIEHNTGHGGYCPQQHFAATARTRARRKQRYWAWAGDSARGPPATDFGSPAMALRTASARSTGR